MMEYYCSTLTTVVLSVSLLGVGLYWILSWRREYHLPPGPWGLPVLGYLPFLTKESFKDFRELAKKYGSVFSLYLGGSYTVVINDYESLKEAFNNSSLWDRPPDNFDIYPGGVGMSGINGEAWIEQRRHTMKTIKDIGVSRNRWEENVKEEVDDFVKMIESHNGRPLNIFKPLSASVSNNTLGIVLGRRLPLDDPARDIVDDGVNSFIRLIDNAAVTSLFPNIMTFLYKMGYSRSAEDYWKMIAYNKYLKKEVEKRKNVPAEVLEETFIDAYLKEIHKVKNNGKSSFTEDNLVGNSTSLLNGGTETTRSSVLWLLLAMATYPRIQQEIQKEIDSVLGRDGNVSWMGRFKLPYTMATLMEGQRWRTLVPLGVYHRASADTKLSGYDVPKDTNVLSNLWALHNDSKHWEKPGEFIPERFLEVDGTLKTQKPYSYAPFSIGRRNCPGETVALMEILHYVVPILQKFQVLPEDESRLPDLEGISSIVHQPTPQNLRYVPRV